MLFSRSGEAFGYNHKFNTTFFERIAMDEHNRVLIFFSPPFSWSDSEFVLMFMLTSFPTVSRKLSWPSSSTTITWRRPWTSTLLYALVWDVLILPHFFRRTASAPWRPEVSGRNPASVAVTAIPLISLYSADSYVTRSQLLDWWGIAGDDLLVP